MAEYRIFDIDGKYYAERATKVSGVWDIIAECATREDAELAIKRAKRRKNNKKGGKK